MEYTFDQAAALLDMGRNTLTRTLRELRMLDRTNLPTGPYRGQGVFVVETGTYNHPTRGATPYTKTRVTEKGLRIIQARIAAKRHALRPSPSSELNQEKTMHNEPCTPVGRLHDVGELTVINEDHGRCHHRVAMVVVFNSPEEAQACVKAGTVRLVPASDLKPDVTEALRHGG